MKISFFVILLFITTKLSGQDFRNTIKQVSSSPYIGQGNPKVTQYAASKDECRLKLGKLQVNYSNPTFRRICGADFMAPLYNPASETPANAKVCIDQFEYPNRPCEYPVVWVRANEAAAICEAEGKRLCDAHEWEGACSGALLPPDYNFSINGKSPSDTVKQRRAQHNRSAQRDWAYGPERKKGICGADSFKHQKCNGGNWQECGSNTYPAGFFPECRSKLAVYDQHGNAAEHMNLPLTPGQFANHPSRQLGHTEMKGSWFIFDKYYAHQDWCRWRAPYWHGSRVRDKKSHHNYHLGFRCCKDVKK